ncbi:hypothetical protein K505DRAFT_79394 [Melanomma pulvis-pyrius CBS 109.77]|uniref:Uncharacterized protein n=1 Tax=Melanomma pulvis-pyrius CBS 109.77 TaxID=1314802 RepID=A0A6A6X2U2_9PLEO|nr:hypothetical protein K505DRAFT_79394 [Melanomma pulvis-pyrius CBS 109.77]
MLFPNIEQRATATRGSSLSLLLDDKRTQQTSKGYDVYMLYNKSGGEGWMEKIGSSKKKSKTYNSRDSPMVTHLTTSPPVSCLCKAERTGSPIFMILWSYVSVQVNTTVYM